MISCVNVTTRHIGLTSLVYDSDVFEGRSLLDVNVNFVSVYEPAMKEWPENTKSIHSDLLEVYEYHQMKKGEKQ